MTFEPWLFAALFLVACVYASVGHGGASGYLAVLSFTPMAPREVAVLALVANVLVAGVSFAAYRAAKHFDWRLLWPFLLGSVPLAFLGASLHLSPGLYFGAVAVVLGLAAVRLAMVDREVPPRDLPVVPAQVAVGGVIGAVSGIVGVGGGIFLSPVLMLTGWADARRTAAVSAAFIIVNSVAGLVPRSADLERLGPQHLGLASVAVAGSLVGAWMGTKKLGLAGLRRVLAVVLVLAAFKLVLKAAA